VAFLWLGRPAIACGFPRIAQSLVAADADCLHPFLEFGYASELEIETIDFSNLICLDIIDDQQAYRDALQ